MKVTTEMNGTTLIVAVQGRLDTTTAPDLTEEVSKCLPDATDVVFDFAELDYISSAGIRTLMATLKTVKAKQGKVTLRNTDEFFQNILSLAGILEFFEVE